jgi:hypothetical protein
MRNVIANFTGDMIVCKKLLQLFIASPKLNKVIANKTGNNYYNEKSYEYSQRSSKPPAFPSIGSDLWHLQK